MKSAKDWIIEHATKHPYRAVTEDDIKEIQLDAWKAGMTNAAYIVLDQTNQKTVEYCFQQILINRDHKKVEDFLFEKSTFKFN